MNKTPILLAGVGGAGGRIVDDAVELAGIDPSLVVAIDTDSREAGLLRHGAHVVVGEDIFLGGGTGGQDTRARTAAREDAAQLAAVLDGVRFAVIVASTGGGVGAGVTPELLSLAYERNIPTLVFAVTPFSFEGEERRRLDARTRALLETRGGGAVVYLENDRLAASAAPDATLDDVRRAASRVAAQGIALLWQLVTKPGYISLDTPTLVTLLRNGRGRARFGFARAEGTDRAAAALAGILGPDAPVAEALASAPAAAIGILGGPDLRLQEVGDVMAALRARALPGASLNMGTVADPALDGTLAVAVLVFESWNDAGTSSATVAPPVRLPRTGTGFAPAPEEPAADIAASATPPPEDAAAETVSPDVAVSPDIPENAPETAPAHHPAEPTPRRSRRAAQRSPLAVTSRKDRFRDTTPYIFQNESLDEPTYLRRGLILHGD